MTELGRVAARIWRKYPQMVAVDVGANIGDTASIIRSGCPAPIICFEGDRTYEALLAERHADWRNDCSSPVLERRLRSSECASGQSGLEQHAVARN